MEMIFTKTTAKKGIKMHSEQAIAYMYKCYMQLEDMKVMVALDPDSLTKLQKRGALCAINFIKEKYTENHREGRAWMVYKNDVTYRVHPKTSPFSTRHPISANYKVVIQLSQPIFLSLSYLNSARHNLVIELCRALNVLKFIYGYIVN